MEMRARESGKMARPQMGLLATGETARAQRLISAPSASDGRPGWCATGPAEARSRSVTGAGDLRSMPCETSRMSRGNGPRLPGSQVPAIRLL